jgi:hypothetical protein
LAQSDQSRVISQAQLVRNPASVIALKMPVKLSYHSGPLFMKVSFRRGGIMQGVVAQGMSLDKVAAKACPE